MLANLFSVGMHDVMIRLDGQEYEHNWLSGDRECFTKTQETIRMVCEEKGLMCEVSTCVNQRNFDFLNDLYKLLQTLGVKRWRLYTAYPKGKATNNKELKLDSYQLRQLMDFIKKVRKEGVIDTYYGCEGFLGKYERLVRDDFYMCDSGVSIGSVLINGDITGCPNVNHKYSQGSIYEGDEFMEVWNTCFDAFRQRNWMHTGICTHCKAFRYCQGNGMHLRNDDGDLLMCNYDCLNLH
jgi:radical SAM protein with 4Fe4S-binding SPASM domain